MLFTLKYSVLFKSYRQFCKINNDGQVERQRAGEDESRRQQDGEGVHERSARLRPQLDVPRKIQQQGCCSLQRQGMCTPPHTTQTHLTLRGHKGFPLGGGGGSF